MSGAAYSLRRPWIVDRRWRPKVEEKEGDRQVPVGRMGGTRMARGERKLGGRRGASPRFFGSADSKGVMGEFLVSADSAGVISRLFPALREGAGKCGK